MAERLTALGWHRQLVRAQRVLHQRHEGYVSEAAARRAYPHPFEDAASAVGLSSTGAQG
ncbi:hypothetical protein [Conexibacter woesei]|uniref:hypothetical protein n=1 Tax=Conexibacter woesei TaxID=191495 RepID=UPI0002D972FA|nr:hypothetical protein [Conexibacter woesei]